jgi:hypothetical protein
MRMKSNRKNTRRLMALLVFPFSLLALALAAQQTTTSLAVNGQQGSAKVVQVQGHNYVDIEGLARLTNGTISFKGNQILLNIPVVAPSSSTGAPAQPPGLSKDFLGAGVEAMASIREWHSALRTAIERSVPLTTGWLDNYQAQAQNALNLASVAISTDSDRAAFGVITQVFNNMRALTDKYVQLNKSLTYFAPDSLQSDPLDQKIVACGHSLAAMASAKQFIDDGSCQ